MKRRKWLLLVTLPLIISGCLSKGSNESNSSGNKSSSSDSSSSSSSSSHEQSDLEKRLEMYDFEITNLLDSKNLKEGLLNDFIFDDYDYYRNDFNNLADSPSLAPNSIQGVSDLYDYCAFYKIPSVSFTLEYSHPSTSIKQELNIAYWNSIMLPGIVGIKSVDIEDAMCTVEFSYSDLANSFHSSVPKQFYDHKYSVIPYLYEGTKLETIPYTGGPILDVYNSDQLIYALVHKYTPNIIPHSPAEVIYNKAEKILKNIIYIDMSEYEKLLAIELYLNSTSIYDNNADSYASYTSDTHATNSEEICSLTSAFYAEGPLLYGSSVCYGYARAQALLALLLGYDVVLTHGIIGANASKNRTDALERMDQGGYEYIYYNAHGINLVKIDGRYGICDPTYRYGNIMSWDSNTKMEIRRDPCVMYKESDWRDKYSTADEVGLTIYKDQLVTTSYDGRTSIRFENDMDLYCGNTLDGFLSCLRNSLDTIDLYKTKNNITKEQIYSLQFYPYLHNNSEKETADNYFATAVSEYQSQGIEVRYFYYYDRYASNSEGYTLFVTR